VKAALEVLDTNKDGNIQLGEFVEWWVATGGPSASASA
jgi:Ca2+-binding EF-hand superfamily protein